MLKILTKSNSSLLKLGLLISVLGLVWFGLNITEVRSASGINSQLNYQGKLSDSSGVQVSDASYNMKFVIYDADSGGNCLWTSVGACDTADYGTVAVTTVNGVFSVALGDTGQNSIATSTIDWNIDSLYLGVTVGADAEMTPRKRLTSSAYSFNADEIDGLHATSTEAIANYLLSLDSYGNLNLMDQGVSSTYATTTWLYVRGDAQIDGNATTTGSTYLGTTAGLNDVYISSWSDLSSQISGQSAWQWVVQSGDNYLQTTSTYPIYSTGASRFETINATTTNIDTLAANNLYLPSTSASNIGIIYKGDSPFIHNYASSTVAGNNTFVGLYAGNFTMGPNGGAEDLGKQNSALGYYALNNNTTGYYNSALGYYALNGNTTGSFNAALSADTLARNTTGNYNTALGYGALFYNNSATNTVAIGYLAATGNNADYNAGEITAVGAASLQNIITGAENNTALGYHSGYNVSSGANNLLLGYQAGDNLTTGSNNIVIGYDVYTPSDTSANTLNIGNILFGTGIDGSGTTLSSGNIGIGTTTPAELFQVGDIGDNQYFTVSAYGNATTSGNLEILGYASTTNLVLADGAADLGTYYDLYVSSGELYFDGTSLSGVSGSSFWQYNPELEKAISPTSTDVGIFVTASSTIAANFRVDGNVTTTNSFVFLAGSSSSTTAIKDNRLGINLSSSATFNPSGQLQIYNGFGGPKLTYSSSNDPAWEGLTINSYMDLSDSNYGVVDLVAGRYTNSESGGSQFRFFTQPRTGITGADPPVLAFVIDKDANASTTNNFMVGNDLIVWSGRINSADNSVYDSYLSVGGNNDVGKNVYIANGGDGWTIIGDAPGKNAGNITLAAGGNPDGDESYGNDGTVNIGNSAGNNNAALNLYGSATTTGSLVIGGDLTVSGSVDKNLGIGITPSLFNKFQIYQSTTTDSDFGGIKAGYVNFSSSASTIDDKENYGLDVNAADTGLVSVNNDYLYGLKVGSKHSGNTGNAGLSWEGHKNVYGLYATATSSGSVLYGNSNRNVFGVYGEGFGTTDGNTVVYGVYGKASGGDTNYAGFFSGDLRTEGNASTTGWLTVGTVTGPSTMGAGDLLVSGNSTTTGQLNVGAGSATDSLVEFMSSGVSKWILGNDYSDNNNFVISSGGTLGTGNIFTLNSIGAATTTGWLVIGTTDPVINMAAGDLLVGRNATTTGNLEVMGYASTTNLVLADGANNLETYYDLYVSSGNLYFDSIQLTGSSGLSFWQYNPELEKAISPTSTDIGLYVTASSTVAANFRVDGNATTTGSLHVQHDLIVEGTASSTNVYVATLESNSVVYSNDGILTNVDPSSLDYKTNVEPIDLNPERILELEPKSYTWINNGRLDFGYIAEEIKEILPELYADDGATKGWKSSKLPFYIVELLKIQQERIDQLELTVSSSTTETSEPLTVIDNPDLEVQTLVVNQAATFYGTIYVKGEAGFEHKVVFNEDIEVKGKIYGSVDQAGTLIIPALATSTEVIFEKDYEVIPKVTATLASLVDIKYAITEKSIHGFRLSVLEPLDQDISFDWIALGVKSDSSEVASNNQPPIIESLTSKSDSVSLGISLNLMASASDPDNSENELVYSWSFEPNLGYISGEGKDIFWTVNESLNENTDVVITLNVSDGVNTVSRSKTVTVLVTPTQVAVSGCTDQIALNYNSEATEDDGSCEYEITTPVVITGCTDQTALNYNPEATEDDSSCQYPEPVAQEGETAPEVTITDQPDDDVGGPE